MALHCFPPGVGAVMPPSVATYAPRDPCHAVLYTVIAEHLETFLASRNDDPNTTGLPAYVRREFYDYLRCGILAHGFLRLGCDSCHQELLVPFRCKRRGFCPSCAARRMAQTAAHLVECVGSVLKVEMDCDCCHTGSRLDSVPTQGV